jgi:hypothetical protein
MTFAKQKQSIKFLFVELIQTVEKWSHESIVSDQSISFPSCGITDAAMRIKQGVFTLHAY